MTEGRQADPQKYMRPAFIEVFNVVCIAVASFADEIGLAFELAFFCAVFFEVLLLIRDFFVTAIAVSPGFEIELPYVEMDCNQHAKVKAKSS